MRFVMKRHTCEHDREPVDGWCPVCYPFEVEVHVTRALPEEGLSDPKSSTVMRWCGLASSVSMSYPMPPLEIAPAFASEVLRPDRFLSVEAELVLGEPTASPPAPAALALGCWPGGER